MRNFNSQFEISVFYTKVSEVTSLDVWASDDRTKNFSVSLQVEICFTFTTTQQIQVEFLNTNETINSRKNSF